MNLDLVFKTIFLAECVLVVFALIAAVRGNRQHWRSTVAGIFILTVSLDINRRVYDRDKKGGGPIYREHWEETVITGETSRSWIIGPCAVKIPKKREGHSVYAFSMEEVEDDIWINSNRHKLAECIRKIKDADTLREVAKLIGFKDESP